MLIALQHVQRKKFWKKKPYFSYRKENFSKRQPPDCLLKWFSSYTMPKLLSFFLFQMLELVLLYPSILTHFVVVSRSFRICAIVFGNRTPSLAVIRCLTGSAFNVFQLPFLSSLASNQKKNCFFVNIFFSPFRCYTKQLFLTSSSALHEQKMFAFPKTLMWKHRWTYKAFHLFTRDLFNRNEKGKKKKEKKMFSSIQWTWPPNKTKLQLIQKRLSELFQSSKR